MLSSGAVLFAGAGARGETGAGRESFVDGIASAGLCTAAIGVLGAGVSLGAFAAETGCWEAREARFGRKNLGVAKIAKL